MLRARPCLVCSRLVPQLKDTVAKADSVASYKEELQDWTDERNKFQALRPVEITRDQLDSLEIPSLQEEIKTKETALPALSRAAEAVT